jgi:lipopolysaccharide export LptBFGC system permease protein LptF
VGGLVVRYFLANLPFFLHVTAPFIPLIAGLYALSRLLRSNELTPMVVAGVSLFRVLRPVFTWTVVFAGLTFLNQELVLPEFTLDQKHLQQQLKGRSSRELANLPIIADRLGNRFIISRYDPHPRRRVATDFILSRTETDGEGRLVLTRHVYAPTARFVERTAERDKGWVLGEGAYEEVLDDSGRLRRHPLDFLGDTALRPRHIEQSKLDKPALSLAELRRLEERTGDSTLRLEMHRHFTHPLKCLVLLLLGLPFLMRAYVRQITIGPLLRCVVTCAAFYLLDFLCLDLGNRGYFGPAVAAWLPFVFAAAAATVVLDRVRT